MSNSSSALVGSDFFEETGYKLLALSMLKDAVSEIARDPLSEAAFEQELWLKGRTDSILSAQLCLDAVAGPNENGLARLRKLVTEEPATAKRLLEKAITQFDELMNRGSEEGSEARLTQYRQMAQSH